MLSLLAARCQSTTARAGIQLVRASCDPSRSAQARFAQFRFLGAAHNFATDTMQVQQQSEATTAEASQSGLALPRKRRARPLEFTQKFQLYKSAIDIQEVAATARRRCQVGAALAATGFSIFLASVAPALPLPGLVMLASAAAANTYALVVTSRRLIRKLAAQHVECIRILPLPEGEPDDLKEPEDEDEGGFASLLFDAATLEDRLAATRNLPLELSTGTTTRLFLLVDPPPDCADLSRLTAELGEGGESSGSRPAAFADLCKLGLIRIDSSSGSCADPALLAALLDSQKVVVEEQIEPRADSIFAPSMDPETPIRGELLLSSMTCADVEEASKAASKGIPAESIEKLGKRARLGGVSVLVAGGLFLLGENARDPDGTPRWKNLNLPMP